MQQRGAGFGAALLHEGVDCLHPLLAGAGCPSEV